MDITNNRKAYHDYEILKKYEAGIVLNGNEIKSIYERNVNLKDSFIKINYKQELFLYNMHISVYNKAHTIAISDPRRARKLLMHKVEIIKLFNEMQGKNLTLIPLKLYFKNNKVKVQIALAQGKKIYDKRNSLKEKTLKRDIDRQIKYRY